MSFLTVLPLAIVMVAGPQILSSIFFAIGEGWQRNSLAYVVGAALSISAIVTLAWLLSDGAVDQGTSPSTIDYVVLAILLVAMAYVYRTREESEPPTWMGRLEAATPRFSFRLGFLLLGFFPTDIITSVSVGSHLAARQLPLRDAAPFVLVTLLLLALPPLAVLAFGERAERVLPEIRDWMNENSWIVNEAVIAFFILLTLNNILG